MFDRINHIPFAGDQKEVLEALGIELKNGVIVPKSGFVIFRIISLRQPDIFKFEKETPYILQCRILLYHLKLGGKHLLELRLLDFPGNLQLVEDLDLQGITCLPEGNNSHDKQGDCAHEKKRSDKLGAEFYLCFHMGASV